MRGFFVGYKVGRTSSKLELTVVVTQRLNDGRFVLVKNDEQVDHFSAEPPTDFVIIENLNRG